MGHDKLRALIDAPENMSVDANLRDNRAVEWAMTQAGKVLAIETIRSTMLVDQRWHDTMAVEGLPTIYNPKPTFDVADKHIIFD